MTETMKKAEGLEMDDDRDLESNVAGPSREDEGQPVIARNLGMIGILALVLGTALWIWNVYESAEHPRFNPVLLRIWWMAGLVLTLLHAFRDRTPTVRRGYGFGGYVLALF